MSKTYKIAIDGPSGAGKSSLAKSLAKEFGFTYIDTGALYRTIAYAAQINGIPFSEPETIVGLLKEKEISFSHIDGEQHVFFDNVDITDKIRTNEISDGASKVSAHPVIRVFLLDFQRDAAKKHSVIMDGRDIGTVVLPDADVKIFLTATAGDRVKRRYEQLLGTKNEKSYTEIERTINERDKRDSEREVAPLKAADDAILLDNSGLEPEQTLEQASRIIRSRLDV